MSRTAEQSTATVRLSTNQVHINTMPASQFNLPLTNAPTLFATADKNLQPSANKLKDE
jgi:hypothetical protein